MNRGMLALAMLWVGCSWADTSNSDDVKMVVTAAFVSESGMPVYREIADYVAGRIGRKAVVVSGASYDEADMLLDRGIIQVGFVCGLPYTHKFSEGKYTLLAIPVVATRSGQFADAASGYENAPGKYFSYTIVRKDSPLQSWADLKGKSYAFSDMHSNSGYNMPRYKLVQLGAKRWEDWFSRVLVTGSHEESIRLVALGIVDASSVDSLVLDYDRSIGNTYAHNVRIIEQLFPGGAGIPPVVLSSKADPALGVQLQRVLLDMNKDPQGRQILDKALLSRFAPPDDRNYDDVRRMEAAARKAGFRDFVER